jgi:hypothetical protein
MAPFAVACLFPVKCAGRARQPGTRFQVGSWSESGIRLTPGAAASGVDDAFVVFGDEKIEAEGNAILVCAGAAPSFLCCDPSVR